MAVFPWQFGKVLLAPGAYGPPCPTCGGDLIGPCPCKTSNEDNKNEATKDKDHN